MTYEGPRESGTLLHQYLSVLTVAVMGEALGSTESSPECVANIGALLASD